MIEILLALGAGFFGGVLGSLWALTWWWRGFMTTLKGLEEKP